MRYRQGLLEQQHLSLLITAAFLASAATFLAGAETAMALPGADGHTRPACIRASAAATYQGDAHSSWMHRACTRWLLTHQEIAIVVSQIPKAVYYSGGDGVSFSKCGAVAMYPHSPFRPSSITAFEEHPLTTYPHKELEWQHKQSLTNMMRWSCAGTLLLPSSIPTTVKSHRDRRMRLYPPL